MAKLPGYELLDCGAGYRLERFADRVLSRPDPNALWPRRLPMAEWQKVHAHFDPEQRFGSSHWDQRKGSSSWQFAHADIRLLLKLTPFKHTGVFPEQQANWQWMTEKVGQFCQREKRTPRILSLFSYTGAASLFLAGAGAEVCHVDASKEVVDWARHNQQLSGLKDAKIRWIVDDCRKFLQKEARRQRFYDAVVLDPPAYGRDRRGKVFKFADDVGGLLKEVKAVLHDDPLFVLFNAYSIGYSAQVIQNLLAEFFRKDALSSHELLLTESPWEGLRQFGLPCGICVRYDGLTL